MRDVFYQTNELRVKSSFSKQMHAIQISYCIKIRDSEPLSSSDFLMLLFQRSSEISNILNSSLKMMKKIVIVITSGVFVTEVMWLLYKKYKHSQRKVMNTSNSCTKQLCKNTRTKIFEVMFFSKDNSLCRPHLASMKPCAKQNCSVVHLK